MNDWSYSDDRLSVQFLEAYLTKTNEDPHLPFLCQADAYKSAAGSKHQGICVIFCVGRVPYLSWIWKKLRSDSVLSRLPFVIPYWMGLGPNSAEIPAAASIVN